MKKDIHPVYYPKAKVQCACGISFIVGATVPKLEVEICSNCHPFYTGKGKLIDAAGRVDKFRSRVLAKEKIARGSRKQRSVKTAARKEKRAKRIEKV